MLEYWNPLAQDGQRDLEKEDIPLLLLLLEGPNGTPNLLSHIHFQFKCKNRNKRDCKKQYGPRHGEQILKFSAWYNVCCFALTTTSMTHK